MALPPAVVATGLIVRALRAISKFGTETARRAKYDRLKARVGQENLPPYEEMPSALEELMEEERWNAADRYQERKGDREAAEAGTVRKTKTTRERNVEADSAQLQSNINALRTVEEAPTKQAQVIGEISRRAGDKTRKAGWDSYQEWLSTFMDRPIRKYSSKD